jgi:His Kinase A (phospho-acceptor) domain
MSHELRTPLAAILGYAELMQEGFYESQGPKSLDALTRIRSNGKWSLANPVFIERLKRGAPLNDPNPATFYSGGAAGYIDYPTLETARVAKASM